MFVSHIWCFLIIKRCGAYRIDAERKAHQTTKRASVLLSGGATG